MNTKNRWFPYTGYWRGNIFKCISLLSRDNCRDSAAGRSAIDFIHEIPTYFYTLKIMDTSRTATGIPSSRFVTSFFFFFLIFCDFSYASESKFEWTRMNLIEFPGEGRAIVRVIFVFSFYAYYRRAFGWTVAFRWSLIFAGSSKVRNHVPKTDCTMCNLS